MTRINMARIGLYLALLAAMVFSGLQLGKPTTAKAEASCCTYGQDCTTRGAPKCCEPGITEADCSEAKKNYCRANSEC